MPRTFDNEQTMNAAVIVQVGQEMGLSDQTIAAALATAMMESNLRNLNYGDRDSLGLFQQRPSQGWGTPEQIRDPKYAARKFFEAYQKSTGSTVLERIANTQRPAAQYRDNYALNFDDASTLYQSTTGKALSAPLTGAAPKVTAADAGQPAATAGVQAQSAGGTVIVTTPAAPTETRPDITPDTPPEEVEEYIKTYYPDIAPFLGDPAIKMLLYAAAINDWDERKLDAAIEQTTYWKTHGPTSRAFDALLAEDPKAAEQLIDTAKNLVGDLFSRNGLTFDDAQIGELAKQAIRAGHISTQGYVVNAEGLNEMVAFGLGASGQPASGEAGATVDRLGMLARQYFVPVTRQALEDWQRKILTGSASEDQYLNWLSGQAKAAFRYDEAVLDSLADGVSPAEHFQSHRAAIAQTLELDEASVDLMDPKFREVLQMRDPETGQVRSMSWVEAEQWARDRPEYANTRGYQTQSASVATDLAKWMGAVA